MPHHTSEKGEKNEVACRSSERREAIRKTIQRRDECRKKAAKVVEQMLEDSVSEKWLLGALHDLSQQDYQDAVEERAILLYCGYPICQNKLTRVPTQKYRICIKTNKVYDITERKQYCSNGCYHASAFLKKQLHDGPLWLRDETEATTEYKLLEKQDRSGWQGEEVDFGWQRPTPEEAEASRKMRDTPKGLSKAKEDGVSPYVPEHTIQKLDARMERLRVSAHPDASSRKGKSKKEDVQDASSRGKLSQDTDSKDRVVGSGGAAQRMPQHSQTPPKEKGSSLPTMTRNHTPGTADHCSWLQVLRTERQGITGNRPKPSNDHPPLKEAEEALKQWMTEPTLTLLLGKKAVEQMKASNGTAAIFSAVQARADHYQSLYARICRQLDREEAEDERLDGKLLDSDDDEAPVEPSAPMPSMEDLKRDADVADLKVYGFYNGDLDTVNDDETASVRNSEETEERKLSPKKSKKQKGPTIPPDIREPVLPVVDCHAQNLLRCRILLDRLRKIFPDILDLLDIELAQVSPDLRELIMTFRLTAENVLFKAPTCRIIALCLTLMLSKRNGPLEEALADERRRSCLEPFMDDLGVSLADIRHLVDVVLSPDDTA